MIKHVEFKAIGATTGVGGTAWMRKARGFAKASWLVLAAASAAVAQPVSQSGSAVAPGHRPLYATAPIEYVIDTGLQPASVRATGEMLQLPTETRWRFACGTNTAGLTQADLERIAADHQSQFAAPPHEGFRTITAGPKYGERAGLTITYQLAGSVPAAAVTSFTQAANYLQAQFSDTYTVTVSVSFANLGSGVIGATGSNFVNNSTYSTVRTALINGQDPDDTIQDFLPTSMLVKRTSAGAANNISAVNMTRANYNVLVGSNAGTAGSMQYNSAFGFDFDPSDGVGSGLLSLTDTIVHETLHAMGFVSRADTTNNSGNIYTLDLFRFQRSTQNPATTADFGTFPRLVSYNDPAGDDVVSDVISGEWRMSDGTPYQASHFFQQSGSPPAAIGIMQPALADSVSFFPNFMKTSDLEMIDAIGWDRGVACFAPSISVQPTASVTVCERSPINLSVTATGTNIEYQWRRNTINLVGQNASTFSIGSASSLNTASYDCVITGDCGTITSNAANVTVKSEAQVLSGPDPQTVCEGSTFGFALITSGTGPLNYQWRRNGTNIPGANLITYSGTASAATAGSYDCVVTGPCAGATSSAAVLTVSPATVITSNPDPQTTCVGGPFSFAVTASGSGTLTYQWRKGGNTIPGATSSTYSGFAAVDDFAAYDCVVTGSCGSATSTAAALTPPDCVYGACAADFDGSGGTPDAGDVDAFFEAWLLGTACADVDCSGGTPDAGDVDAFFALWLSGGC